MKPVPLALNKDCEKSKTEIAKVKQENRNRLEIFKKFVSHILFIISEGIKLEKFDIFGENHQSGQN